MSAQTILLIIIAVILLVGVLVLFGGGMAVGGMAMMGGMMASPIGWVVLLLILALGGFLAYTVLYAH